MKSSLQIANISWCYNTNPNLLTPRTLQSYVFSTCFQKVNNDNSTDMRCKLVESGFNSSGEAIIYFSFRFDLIKALTQIFAHFIPKLIVIYKKDVNFTVTMTPTMANHYLNHDHDCDQLIAQLDDLCIILIFGFLCWSSIKPR